MLPKPGGVDLSEQLKFLELAPDNDTVDHLVLAAFEAPANVAVYAVIADLCLPLQRQQEFGPAVDEAFPHRIHRVIEFERRIDRQSDPVLIVFVAKPPPDADVRVAETVDRRPAARVKHDPWYLDLYLHRVVEAVIEIDKRRAEQSAVRIAFHCERG